MQALSEQQRQVLRWLEVEVWRRRDAAAAQAVAPPAEAKPAQAAAPPVETPSPAPQIADAPGDYAPDEPRAEIEDAAPADDDLPRIATEIAACKNCELHAGRTNTVPGEGDANADWMFIGEGPGQTEDAQGRPFVGRAGQLLDAMINALGKQRAQVYIANVVKCRPPNNRDPQPAEVAACGKFLQRQLRVIKPRIIVVLGRVAAQSLLQTTEPLGKLRGKIYHYGEGQTPMIVTYHPAYLLRSPGQKEKAWEDLWRAREVLEKG